MRIAVAPGDGDGNGVVKGPGRAGNLAALLIGATTSFWFVMSLARAIRPGLFFDPDPAWAIPRLGLGLAVALLSAGAAAFAAGLFLVCQRAGLWTRRLEPLPLPRAVLGTLAVGALFVGVGFRFACLERLPFPLWHDDLLLVAPSLALSGGPGDFRDAIRPVVDQAGRVVGTVGVLYLEVERLVLAAFGTSVFGVRFLSALGGSLSIVTAMLLARALLPRGGAATAGMLLAGLRWSLIVSRWGWNMILLAPIADLAALAALRARRRGSLGAALAAGAAAGAATHVYLAAWIVGAALLVFLLWPGGRRNRFRTAGFFALSFGLLTLPIFLLREGRAAPYFVRTEHNVLREAARAKSVLPLLASASDALAAPWILEDPEGRNDLAGRRRLPLVAAVPLALAFWRAAANPLEDLSALLLAHAGAAAAAFVAWGSQLSPNGSRFAYLTTLSAVGAAAGILWLIGFVAAPRRPMAGLACLGAIALAGAFGAGDLERWDRARATFDSFGGESTTVGRAALRWDRYGSVQLEPDLGVSRPTVEAIRRFAVVPAFERSRALGSGPGSRERLVRVAPAGAAPLPGERVVEHVRDGWGRPWAVVLAKRAGPA
ncbi:MAG TPA: glycosyltransferase family 39 protein [Thermoanaerobaculia bacterium]|nr:glycosyltransferase family 39 protein [Thermoanaerobaculia bacterium]